MLTVVPVTKVRLILRMPKEWRVEVCVSSKKKFIQCKFTLNDYVNFKIKLEFWIIFYTF